MGDALSVAEVLERAAEIVGKPNAWSGNADRINVGGPPCHCTWTAIIEAAGASPGEPDVPAVEFFARHIGGRDEADIWDWNDADGRTLPEVLTKLREAAVRARTKGGAA